MVINIENVSEDVKSKIIDLLDGLGIDYGVFNNSWDCYVTDEMKASVPVYYGDTSSDYINKLTEECIDRAIGDQDELLHGDALYDFIESVSKNLEEEE